MMCQMSHTKTMRPHDPPESRLEVAAGLFGLMCHVKLN